MKIAYFINQYPTASHSFIRREILALERQGVEVERFALRKDLAKIVDREDKAEIGKTRYILDQGWGRILLQTVKTVAASPLRFARVLALALRMGVRSDRGSLRHLIYVAEACVLKEWLVRARISHLHAHFGTNSAAIAMFCGVLGDVDYSFTVHGPEEFDKAEFIAIGEKIRRAKFVAAITSYCRSQLYRQVESDHWPKIHQVHCGVDRQFLETEIPQSEHVGAGSDEIVFTCIGRLCEQKGQLLLIDAVKQLVDDGARIRLILAGDGPMRGAIEQRIASYQLQDCVEITGWVDSAQVRAYLLASKAMVLPSFAEGLPVVIMEAMALQKPVITTYIAGIPELVQDGVNGWLVPAGCSNAIAAALKRAIAASGAACREMGSVGREMIQRRHNIDTEAAKLVRLFGGAA